MFLERLNEIENELSDQAQIGAGTKETITYLKKLLSEIDFSLDPLQKGNEERSARQIGALMGTELSLNQISLIGYLLHKNKN